MAASLVAGIYVLWLLWKCRCRVKAERKTDTDENTAVKLPDISSGKASKSIHEVDEIPTCEIIESSKTVAGCYTFGTDSDTEESRGFQFANNEESKSKTTTDRETISLLSIGSSRPTMAEPLVEEQFTRVVSTITSTTIFSSKPKAIDEEELFEFPRSLKSINDSTFGKPINTNDKCSVDAVNQPNIPSHISTLPTFDTMLLANTNKTGRDVKEELFKFSSRINVTDTSKNLKSINNFTISEPINANDKDSLDDLHTFPKTLKVESNGSKLSSSTSNSIWLNTSTDPGLKPKFKKKDPPVGRSSRTSSSLFIKAVRKFDPESKKTTKNTTAPFMSPATPAFGISTALFDADPPRPAFKDNSTPSMLAAAKDAENAMHRITPQSSSGSNLSENNTAPTPAQAQVQENPFSFGSNTSKQQPRSGFGKASSAAFKTTPGSFTFNSPKPNPPAFGQTAPITTPMFGTLQSFGQNQAKPTACSLGTPVSGLEQNKAMPTFTFGSLAADWEPNKSKLVFESAAPAFKSSVPVPVAPKFSFGTLASDSEPNKSKLVFESAALAFNTGCKSSVPVPVAPKFSFGTLASDLELNKSKLVFGSAAPAFNTGWKSSVPVSVAPSKPKFGGLPSDTASVYKLKGNITNRSYNYSSSSSSD